MMLAKYTGLLAIWASVVFAVSLEGLIRDVARVESVRAIKDLQKTYCHLAQFGQWEAMASLFALNGTIQWGRTAPLEVDTVVQRDGIEEWLREEAGDMDGVREGSLNVHLNEGPLVSLSEDGASAKARWQVLRLMGDGEGETRIEGGVYENQYIYVEGSGDEDSGWKISVLRYYPMFAGDYAEGWGNVGTGSRALPIIPYHFTPDEAGIPIQLPEDIPRSNSASDEESTILHDLEYRIGRLNDEDDVRNLQHTSGYYIDQRMWTDILDLCTDDAEIIIDGTASSGHDGIRKVLEEWMGTEGLEYGVLNEYPTFDTLVEVGADGLGAVARGLQIGMIGDTNERRGSWEFNVFRTEFVKDSVTGMWRIKTLGFTRLVAADYQDGWANGGRESGTESAIEPPAFISRSWRTESPEDYWSPYLPALNSTADILTHLSDKLSQAAAFDESENVGSAYGYFADDIRCNQFADLHAQKGFKESPGVGWYFSRDRIAQACLARYNTIDPNPQRPNVPFHWRIQPVILPSPDGRSSSMRAKLLQFGTSSNSKAGFNGVWGFNGGMYHDQFVLEEHEGKVRRKLWCLTIDEFYWQSPNWAEGWASQNRKVKRDLVRRQGLSNYPPDVSLKDPKLGDRENGFMGGPTDTVNYPDIQTMWFSYRNPVSGRLPENYWGPGCVPCRGAKPEWALTANGYQEPWTGPTLIKGERSDEGVLVDVTAGPEEKLAGVVELWMEVDARESVCLGSTEVGDDGAAVLEVLEDDLEDSDGRLMVVYLGNDNIQPARAIVG